MPVLARCTATIGHRRLLPGATEYSAALVTPRSRYDPTFHDLRFVSASSAIALDRQSRRYASLPFRDEPNIDSDSLAATLEAHRDANRASIIYRTYGKGIRREPISVPSSLQRESKRPERPTYPVRRLKLQQSAQSVKLNARDGASGYQDYSGENREISRDWRITQPMSSSETCPWMKQVPRPADIALEQLNAEIRAFESYMSPDPQEKAAANHATADLFACIQRAEPSVEIDVIGSRSTGLATSFSDMDINVSPKILESKADVLKLLRYLSRNMRKPQLNPYPSARSPVRVNAVIYARVPIVTGVHVSTGLEFQIQCATDGLRSMEYTRSFISEYPTFRALVVLLKHMLGMRRLTEGSSGGLTSYPLIGMILAALRFSDGKFHKHDVGQQLLFFLDMFSEIDFYKTGISLSPLEYGPKRPPGSSLPSSRKSRAHFEHTEITSPLSDFAPETLGTPQWHPVLAADRPYLMSLQDPSNERNDLGRGVFLIKHVQATLISIRQSLRDSMKAWEDFNLHDNTENGSRMPLLASLVGGDYRMFEHERAELRIAGTRTSRSKVRRSVDSGITMQYHEERVRPL